MANLTQPSTNVLVNLRHFKIFAVKGVDTTDSKPFMNFNIHLYKLMCTLVKAEANWTHYKKSKTIPIWSSFDKKHGLNFFCYKFAIRFNIDHDY